MQPDGIPAAGCHMPTHLSFVLFLLQDSVMVFIKQHSHVPITSGDITVTDVQECCIKVFLTLLGGHAVNLFNTENTNKMYLSEAGHHN